MKMRLSNELAGVDLVGTASTLYTDPKDPRFELALETAEHWRDNNLPYVVIDGSPMEDESDTWVKDAHEQRGAIVVRSDLNGLASQRKQGVAYAFSHGAEKVVGHEPEKILISEFSDQISDALDHHAVLVIGRTATALESLPTTQAWTERMAGWVLQQTHHLPADSLSGGRGFTAAGADVLAKYPAEKTGFNNWLYLYNTPLEARSEGLSVGGLMIDLIHPKRMTDQEQDDPTFDRKRYDQFKSQLDYLMARSDVDPAARLIAVAVQRAMSGLSSKSTNADFELQLKRLERRLTSFGYAS